FLADAKAQLGEKVLASCIACHAPAAAVTADYKFESRVSQEGVTCNFCHNVSAVDPSSKPASYTFEDANPLLMRGPYSDSDPGRAPDLEDEPGQSSRPQLPRPPRGRPRLGRHAEGRGRGRPPEALRGEPEGGACSARRRRGHACDRALGFILRRGGGIALDDV